MTMDFNTALDLFVNRLRAHIDEHFAQNYSNLTPPRIVLEPGSKFIKVVKVESGTGGCSVHSFIVRKGGTTKALGTVKPGDVLKAASWKQPAKHVRGTIFSEDFGGYGVDTYGARYLF